MNNQNVETNAETSNKKIKNTKFLILISLAAGMAGLLYGYDTACISGAIGFLKQLYQLSTMEQGMITSAIMIGGMIGVAFSGTLSDHFGRRKVLRYGAILFAIASLLSAFTKTPGQLITTRIIGGIGIGLASSLATTYISEIAPANVRGTLSSLYQLLTTIGIALTYFVNLIVVDLGTYKWNIFTGWRWMLGIGSIPAILFFIALLIAPESPRWLIQHAQIDEGLKILEKINNKKEAKHQMIEIANSIQMEHHASLKKLFQPGLRKALLIGLFLAFLNQAAGMNVLMYYGPTIFKNAGFGGNSDFMATAGVGVVNVIATIFATLMIDKAGRRKLLIIGEILLSICSAIIMIAFHIQSSSLMMIGIFAFVISFAISAGPIPWIMIPELFPTYLRSRAAGICTVLMWGCNWAIGQFTPVMLGDWGGSKTFMFFMFVNILICIGVYFWIPETKNKSLEEIEKEFWNNKDYNINNDEPKNIDMNNMNMDQIKEQIKMSINNK